VRRCLVPSLILLAACSAPAPQPAATPPPPAAPAPPPFEEHVIGSVRVTASALNVRSAANGDAEVIVQKKKGDVLEVLASDESWTKVRLDGNTVGWVASPFVADANQSATSKVASKTSKRRSGCPADSDFAFVQAPVLAFSDRGGHGLVVVEANVNTSGKVTATKVVSNSTGDDALGHFAEREIATAKFSPPIRNCVPRSFIFTYRRTF
jgi:TonB family protein